MISEIESKFWFLVNFVPFVLFFFGLMRKTLISLVQALLILRRLRIKVLLEVLGICSACWWYFDFLNYFEIGVNLKITLDTFVSFISNLLVQWSQGQYLHLPSASMKHLDFPPRTLKTETLLWPRYLRWYNYDLHLLSFLCEWTASQLLSGSTAKLSKQNMSPPSS